MRLKMLGWLLLGLCLLGCASTPATDSTNLPLPSVLVPQEPALEAVTMVPLPSPLPAATQTAVLAVTPMLKSVATSEGDAVEPSATFAAYGVAQALGTSAGGRPLDSYRFGYGTDPIVLVGGMHGGYEWNTIVLAYEIIDYFLANPEQIPANVSLYIIPSANPDGQYRVTGRDGRFTAQDVVGDTEPGRFNANQVDLNRNWACDWQPEGLWGNQVVSGGMTPFSEPETNALRSFFLRERPEVVLFWHSKADGIYVGSCDGLHAPSKQIADIYGAGSGYNINETFTAYSITGDASDWLTTQNIPSFTVELQTHSKTDYAENLAGVLALLDYYGR